MSGKFSVEDILNEVKLMKGNHYISESSAKHSHSDGSSEKGASFISEKKANYENSSDKPAGVAETVPTPVKENESILSDDTPITSGFDISKMTPEEFFKSIEQNASHSTQNESGIVGGFTVKTDAIKEAVEEKKDAADFENEHIKEAVTVEAPTYLLSEDDAQAEDEEVILSNQPVKSDVFDEDNENVKKFGKKNEKLSDTIVFDRNQLKEAALKNAAKDSNEQRSVEQDIDEIPGNDDIIGNNSALKNRVFNEHKPNHLLKPEEINSNSMNSTFPLRFGNKIKDLTKNKGESEKIDEFAAFKEPVLSEDEIEAIEENNANEVLEFVHKAFEASESTDEAEELNNTVDQVIDVPEISETPEEPVGITYKKQDFEDKAFNRESNIDRGFARKTARRIDEVAFDYSEDDADEEEVIDDYCSIDDEEPVRFDIDISFRKISKRLTFTVITFILSIFVTVFPAYNMSLLSAVSPTENPTGFLVANLAVLAVAAIINIKSILRGIGSLITFRPDVDSAVSVAFLLTIAQSVFALIPDFNVSADKITLFSSVVIFTQILLLMGKKRMVSRVKSNFRMVATTTVKQSCFVADERMGELIENDDFIGTPDVACSKSVINLRDYLRSSYSEDPSDSVSKLFAPIGLLATLLTFLVSYFSSYDIVASLSYAVAVSVMSVPASAVLSVNSPLKKAADTLRQREGLLSGYAAVDEFSNVDCVTINAEEIFPAGAVELISLRAIGDVSIEDVILKSAALTIGAGGPLADVFDKIIDGRRKMLPPVSDIVYEDGLGLTGKIDGRVVRIGNRKFIDSYGIYGLSDDSLEQKAENGGFFVVYTAIEDEVCGMFAVKYKSVDPDIEDALYELVSNGITIAVKSNDPNVTPKLIEDVFEIPSDYIIVLESHAAEYYDNITRPSKNGSGMLAYNSNASVFAFLIAACKKLRSKISVAVLLQSLLTVIGFAACMFFAISGRGLILPLNMVLYHFVVAIICTCIPAFIKRIK